MASKVETGSVRSVERALAIVELIGQHQALGLEELHYLTGLAKATVSRMLLTLQEQGWIYRGLSDRRYRLSARSLFGDSRQRFKRQMVEQAAPWLLELSARTGLVTDLSSFDGESLEVLESAVPEVLRKRYPSNSRIVGQHASLFHSAMGKACLGALASAEVERLAEQEQVPAEARQQCLESQHLGFGQRTEGHWEYPVRLPFLIRAVALPLQTEGRVIGSIALHWPRDLACVEQVRNRHLWLLAETVEQVQKDIA
ncbi:IclR family mhp operon transcriptional activator [Pseudomonas protegens]|jgi:DNA-binding IclR family transcriptional regulator|uniref:IclR family transcriptional regulator n=1 Tax=Pseudomonas TaxID=286 RepID=UPI00069F5A55|nr:MULTISPECIES: IclR family transcriptional regulator [Pseudomonas]GED76112.1 transcriptional regulator [Pseudomonas fluorescens]AQT08110.1 IclR family transcriptional regulator [Pseudomonas protegens]MBB1616447.1 IclR family transcriptional regulator [Pseudomonas sp. UMC65]MBB1619038.1 IclR family transcriptional regulator [Pseudomonas sp. UME65]MBF0639992.1 IclR family transcriptional regulator [Pseudomonas protegens]